MERLEIIENLISYLLDAEPEYRRDAEKFDKDERTQRYLLRALMNVWDPRRPISKDYFKLQDELLTEETKAKGPVSAEDIPTTKRNHLKLWQGDITRLKVDAIVNAANSQLLGCFVPGHNCIDNAIHSAAGLQLRLSCFELMRVQGHEEETGGAKITKGYNLPAKYVIHTVGPIIEGRLKEEDKKLLASCYESSLKLADEKSLSSIAFCCISTGLFRFPHRAAAEIALKTVEDYLKSHPETHIRDIIFNVFKDEDKEIYEKLFNQ